MELIKVSMSDSVNERGQWKNQSTFILAAIGSAVGLGSIWRFPFICARNGGGAFLIAYVIAMLVVGMPILIAELSSGHKIKGSICKVFVSVNPKFEILGWFVLAIAFVIISYYVVIMGWTCKYLVDAFTLKWGADTCSFFRQTTLGLSKDPSAMWQVRWDLLSFLVVAWITIMTCIWRGPDSIGKIIHASIYIPAVILVIMVVRGVTLQGSLVGLSYYLRPDFIKLASLGIWLDAFTQAFFSLGTGLGVMYAYGSYLPDRANIVGNAIIITVSTTLVAFLGGLAVFGSLGFLAIQSGTEMTAIINQGGAGLAFVSYPAIINSLPVFKKTFGVLFFTMLLVLSLNSAFSMVEAVASSLRDKFGWSHEKSNLTVSTASFMFGILFITRGGYAWLDYFDYFSSSIGIATACIFNCLVIGWFLDANKLIDHVILMPGPNLGITWSTLCKFVIFGLLIVTVVHEIIYGSRSFTQECPEFMNYVTAIVFGLFAIIATIISNLGKKHCTF